MRADKFIIVLTSKGALRNLEVPFVAGKFPLKVERIELVGKNEGKIRKRKVQ